MGLGIGPKERKIESGKEKCERVRVVGLWASGLNEEKIKGK